MTPKDKKEQIITIVAKGLDTARNLPHEDLRTQILDHFEKIQNFLQENLNLIELERVAKKLTVGVMESFMFGDIEILVEVELQVRESLDGFDNWQ